MTTAQIGSAAVLLLPVVLLTGVAPHGQLTSSVTVSMVLLGALGTGLAFVWMNRVINAVGSTTAATVTYLTPVVAAVIGFVAFGERLSWNEPVGAAVVIAGILVAQGLPARRTARTPVGPAPVAQRPAA